MSALSNILKTNFWRAYFHVYDRNQSLPYLRLIGQNAGLVVNGRRGGCFLDAGCGTGNSTGAIAAELSAQGKVIGLDNSTEALRRAGRKFPGLEFVRASLDQPLPCASASLDGVLANNSLYLVSDPARTMLEILRVIKPGGRLVISNPNDSSSASAIFKEHLSGKRAGFIGRYGRLLGDAATGAHAARAAFNFLLILPFELALQHNVKMGSNFWPLSRWLSVVDEVKADGRYRLSLRPPLTAYAGTNHTLVIDRLA